MGCNFQIHFLFEYEISCADRFEDGETDGIRIPDNSVRKTPRFRSINANGSDPIERRKSRRHSTGTTPNSANGQQQKCYSPRSPAIAMHQQTLDEDSSSSTNSGELNDVFGVHKSGGGVHESAGVTPGLRRRRERAERQKSFLREQQEAAASGLLRPFDIKDEIISNHGMNTMDYHPEFVLVLFINRTGIICILLLSTFCVLCVRFSFL